MSNDEKPSPDKSVEDEAPGGWQALAEEEPTAGTLAPSDELEAALAEASDAIESRQAVADSADAAQGSAESVILEALSAELQTLKAAYEAGCEELEQLKDSNLRLPGS